MSVITKIETQKKCDDRVNIYVDDTFFMAIFKELIFSFNIKKGDIIDKENLKLILRKEMFIKAKNKALNILSKTDVSEKKIIEKLSIDFEYETIDDVLDFLRKYNFINDNLLAQKIINTNINVGKCGKNRIKQNLYNKGIDKSTIEDTMSTIDYETEFENAMYLAKKRYERIKSEEKTKIYQKISQHLAYKGFSYDIVSSVLRKLLNYDECEI